MAQLTKRGLLAAVVCSDSFMKLGKAQSKVFGVPDLPLLEIKHPLGGLDMAKVRERAEAALPQLYAFIRTAGEKSGRGKQS